MDAYEPTDSLHDLHGDARRRLDARRDRESAQGPEIRGLLTRAEAHLNELRGAAEVLAAVLPTRVEAAVARALGDGEGGVGRRLESMRVEVRDTAEAVARVEQDLLAERVGRIEDLELVVELLAQGIDAVRSDVAGLAERFAGLESRLDEPLQVTVERPRPAGVRHLFARTEHAPANGASEPDGSGRPVP